MNTKSLRIKICGLKDASQILQIADMQPDFIGFIFYRNSPRYILDGLNLNEQVNMQFQLSAISHPVQKVGVFVDEDIKSLIRLASEWELDYIQLHGDETPEYCEELRMLDFKLIKAFGIDEHTDWSVMEAYDEYCDYFLFDTKTALHGGSGMAFNWDLLSRYRLSKPLFLSGGIGVDDIPRIKQLAQTTAVEVVDLNSKLEISPGIKDINLCRQAIELCKTQE